MASIKNIKLRDLYFIEDNKHRRAFLKALREVEEEGFEIEEAETATIMMKNLKAEAAEKQKLAANVARNQELKGSTPADLSVAARFKSQAAKKYSETNAIDLKDYKYWRSDEIKKIQAEEERKNVTAKSPSPFDFSRSMPKKKSGATLYDELFGDDDDDGFKPYPKTKTYRALEGMLDGDDDVNETKASQSTQSFRESYLAKHKDRIEKNKSLVHDVMSERKEKVDAEKKKADMIAEAQKIIEEKKAAKSTQSIQAKVAPKTEVQPETKLVVEVIAPEIKQEKPKVQRKPRGKGKKKMDHDIKRFHSIKID
ncbi:MAG: hypothetical protein IJW24_03420 [Clostridia bacterium]|nr:hypothetical protein [Clostridia bacterium]